MKRKGNKMKRRGFIAEMRFWVEAMRRGLTLSKPQEDARYDSVADNGNDLWRVQVKSCNSRSDHPYGVNLCGADGQGYTHDEVDFIAAYVAKQQEWYILPIEVVEGKRRVSFGPQER